MSTPTLEAIAVKPIIDPPAIPKPPRRWRPLALAAVIVLASAYAAWQYFGKTAVPVTPTVEVRRGDIRLTISATGKVQAVTTVQVGTQVSGTVSELHADFNSRVKAGQIVARLDPSRSTPS
jgi:HlyD family secretion protein